MADKYVPLTMSVRKLAGDVCYDEVTESRVLENRKGNRVRRVHTWDGERSVCITTDDREVFGGKSPLELYEDCDPNDDVYVPTPAQVKLMNLNCLHFTPSFPSMEELLREVAARCMMEEDRYAQLRGKAMDEAMRIVAKDTATISLYKQTMRNTLSNHKMQSKRTLFSHFGYLLFSKRTLADDDRKMEVNQIIEKFLVPVVGDNGIISEETIDCSVWRTRKWDELCNKMDTIPKEPDCERLETSATDILFANNAARLAFLFYMGSDPYEHCSLIKLASADAWFTTNALMLFEQREKDSGLGDVGNGERGGNRNIIFSTVYRKLVRRSVTGLVETILERVKTIVGRYPSPVKTSASKGQEGIYNGKEVGGDVSDGEMIEEDEIIERVYIPSMGKMAAFVKGDAFRTYICDWFPVIDAYVTIWKELVWDERQESYVERIEKSDKNICDGSEKDGSDGELYEKVEGDDRDSCHDNEIDRKYCNEVEDEEAGSVHLAYRGVQRSLEMGGSATCPAFPSPRARFVAPLATRRTPSKSVSSLSRPSAYTRLDTPLRY